MISDYWLLTTGYCLALLSGLALPARVEAQDLFMRRSNTHGHWRSYTTNQGVLFNKSNELVAGGWWTDPTGREVGLLFGTGLWLGGLYVDGNDSVAQVSFSYDPRIGEGAFVPGSIIYGGWNIDSSQLGRERYRVYVSTDAIEPIWPIRFVNGRPRYIDEPALRAAAGPPATIGTEDVFVIYKDTDPLAIGRQYMPIGVEIRTQTGFFSHGIGADIAIVHNEIIYTGDRPLHNPVLSLVVDSDIDLPEDDRLKGLQAEGVRAAVFFSDAKPDDPFLGVVLLKGQSGPDRPTAGLSSFRYWNIADDPETPAQMYSYIEHAVQDTATSQRGDARLIMSSASKTTLEKGDTIYIDYAVFAMPSEGRNALHPIDSARVLERAALIQSLFLQNRLDLLDVRKSPAATGSKLNIKVHDGWIAVTSTESGPAVVFDILGREVARSDYARSDYAGSGNATSTSQSESRATEHRIPADRLPSGVYVVRVGTASATVRLGRQ